MRTLFPIPNRLLPSVERTIEAEIDASEELQKLYRDLDRMARSHPDSIAWRPWDR